MKTESVSHCDEVITGSSAAADYVNFTGHSLLGHNFFFFTRSVWVKASPLVASSPASERL